MKKIVFALLFCMLSLNALCQSSANIGSTTIQWQVTITDNPVTGGVIIRRSPAKLPTPPETILYDNVLCFMDSHAEYTLYIIDEDGEEVFEVFIPEDTTTITLPSYLEGEYELQIIRGNNCFYGYIEL
jgi:hypothetical protein